MSLVPCCEILFSNLTKSPEWYQVFPTAFWVIVTFSALVTDLPRSWGNAHIIYQTLYNNQELIWEWNPSIWKNSLVHNYFIITKNSSASRKSTIISVYYLWKLSWVVTIIWIWFRDLISATQEPVPRQNTYIQWTLMCSECILVLSEINTGT